MILGIIGPEGAGKSCLMTYFGLLHVARGGKLRAFPGFEITDGHNKVLSVPLEFEEWVTLPPELRDILIDIDEIGNFFGSDRYMAWINKLFAGVAGQRRHRNIGIHYTVQDWGELDPRIRRKTHVLVICKDLYWSPWGKEQEVKRGELISATFFDVLGFFTGEPWSPGPQFLLRAKGIWQHYNSFSDVDIFAGMTKVKFKKPTITIDLTGGPEEDEQPAAGAKDRVPISGDDTALLGELFQKGVDPATLGRLGRRLAKGE